MTVATPPLPHAPRAFAGKVMGVAYCRCGAPIEIQDDTMVCPRGCVDPHETMVLQAVRGPRPGLVGRPSPRKGQPRGTYVLKAKPCRRCTREFQPTGPAAKFCRRPDCSSPL